MDIEKILIQHKAWLNGDGGCRADLRNANLEDVDLRNADLRGADLRNANLRDANLLDADLEDAGLRNASLPGANLRGANLRGANLRGANLRYANLLGANFRGAFGFVFLPVQDMRGYSFVHAVLDVQWRIRAGCRYFTIPEAKAHWGSVDYQDKVRGKMYVSAVEWLEDYIKYLELNDEG